MSSVTNEGNVTAEFIVAEADAIWRAFREAKIPQSDTAALDAYYNKEARAHPQLTASYPTVLRHMLQEGRYSSRAFAKYLKKLSKSPWTNDEERLDSYADYYVMLYKENPRILGSGNNPHWNETEAALLRKNYRRVIAAEHKQFVESIEKITKNLDAEQKKFALDRFATALRTFNILAKSRGLSEENINSIHDQVANGTMPTELLEQICGHLQSSPIVNASALPEAARRELA